MREKRWRGEYEGDERKSSWGDMEYGIVMR